MFFDRLTVCPACGGHHVNVREVCSTCKTSHISPVALLHHFRCGYVGPADAFSQQGRGRICPKCHGRLEDLGTDHDVPGENFVCHSCHASFQVPEVEGLCLSCQTRTAGVDLPHRDIYSYRINSMGIAAIAAGRLFGKDEELLLEGEGLPIYRRHVFTFLIEDERNRASRYATDFCVIMLRLDASAAEDMESVALNLANHLRSADKIGRYDEGHLLVLLPSTEPAAGGIWLERFLADDKAKTQGKVARGKVVELKPEADLAEQLGINAAQLSIPGASAKSRAREAATS